MDVNCCEFDNDKLWRPFLSKILLQDIMPLQFWKKTQFPRLLSSFKTKQLPVIFIDSNASQIEKKKNIRPTQQSLGEIIYPQQRRFATSSSRRFFSASCSNFFRFVNMSSLCRLRQWWSVPKKLGREGTHAWKWNIKNNSFTGFHTSTLNLGSHIFFSLPFYANLKYIYQTGALQRGNLLPPDSCPSPAFEEIPW